MRQNPLLICDGNLPLGHGNGQREGSEFLSVPPLVPSRYELQRQLWATRDWLAVWVFVAGAGWITAGVLVWLSL